MERGESMLPYRACVRSAAALALGTVALVFGAGRSLPARAVPAGAVSHVVVGARSAALGSTTAGGGSVGSDGIWAGVTLTDGVWIPGSSGCNWGPYAGGTNLDTVPGGGVPSMVRNGVRYQLFVRVCPNQPVRTVWVPDVPPTFLATAGRSVLARTVPPPTARLAPPAHRGVVHVGTWFWTDPAVWRPVSVTASIPTTTGVMWVTTTATPSVLRLDPGDGRWGSGAQRCVGPGVPWLSVFGDEMASPMGCTYTYRHASVRAVGRRAFPARMAIEWEVTWRASTGAMGRGGRIESATAVPITVREVQALGVE